MVIDIRTIPEGHSILSRETDLGELQNDLPEVCGKILSKAAIDRSGSDLYIHLQFHCSYKLECSRCLEPIYFPVDGDLRVTVKEQAGKHGPVSDDESIDYFYDSRNFNVDLGPSIYEEISVSFPLKPLCSENCRGVEKFAEATAPADRKAGEKKEIDPRWAALKNLKKQ